MKTYVTGSRPPHLELVIIRLGSCAERRAFGRLLFLPGVVSPAQVPGGAACGGRLWIAFVFFYLGGLKVRKDRAKGPSKGESGGRLTVSEQPVCVAKSPEAVLY